MDFMTKEIFAMKYLRSLAVVAALAAMCSLSAFARDTNRHSVEILDAVQVGNTQLRAGTYQVQWQGTGPDVQVNFIQHGKTVATAAGTLKTNDPQVVQDSVVVNSSRKTLDQIDFHHDRTTLRFQSGT
jgi:hypothetical protein